MLWQTITNKYTQTRFARTEQWKITNSSCKNHSNAKCLVNYLSDFRLHDFTVGLTDTLPTTTTGPDMSPHQVCVIYNGVFPAAAMTLMCKHFPRGRYLFIQINGLKGELLTLCEVEVYCKCTTSGQDIWTKWKCIVSVQHRDKIYECTIIN